MPKEQKHLNLAVIGHVDSGKSTSIGHLIYKCGSIDKRAIEKFELESAEMGKESSCKFAWVMDKLKEERERGLSIEVSLWNFETTKYVFTGIDTPGHRDFTKNTIMGLSQADAALLVVSAAEGEFEDSISPTGQATEHALLAYAMGIKQIILVVNKMDATKPIPYSQARFDDIKEKMGGILIKVGFGKPTKYATLPISGWTGHNMLEEPFEMPWFKGWSITRKEGNASGVTLFQALDALIEPKRATDKPLRLPLSGINQVEGIGTVPIGCVMSGTMKCGTEVTFCPGDVSATVKSIEMHHNSLNDALAGDNVGFAVDVDHKRIRRGMVAGQVGNDPPRTAVSFVAQIMVLNVPKEIKAGFTPVVMCHTSHTCCKVDSILSKMNPQGGKVDSPASLKTRDKAVVKFVPMVPMCVESFNDFPSLGRIVVRNINQTIAVGVVTSVEKEA